MDPSTYLNKDILLEISFHLFHCDLYNLKIALPNINLTKEIYISAKIRMLEFFSKSPHVHPWDIFQSIINSPYKDYFMKTTEIKITDITTTHYVLLNCPAIMKILHIDFSLYTISSIMGISFNAINYIFENVDDLINMIFKTRGLEHAYQLEGIYVSAVNRKLVNDNLEIFKLSDIDSYTDGILGWKILMVTPESLYNIYCMLDDEHKKELRDSTLMLMDNPEIRHLMIHGYLSEFIFMVDAMNYMNNK